MKRYHQEQSVMARRMKVALQWIGSDCRYVIPGRMRKKHPLDCGNTRCGVCSHHKRNGHEETRQEKIARLVMAEGFE